MSALVLRTQPNQAGKRERDYSERPGPFFTVEAIEFMLEIGVEHLVVDFASIDKAQDGGRMENHHRFWGIPAGRRDLGDLPPSPRTITEFAYIPDTAPDGMYLLDLQVAPFALDAAPSRPVLFKLKEHE